MKNKNINGETLSAIYLLETLIISEMWLVYQFDFTITL